MVAERLTNVQAIATPAAAGGAGVSTATKTDTQRLYGLLEGFLVKFTSCPATTDTTLTLLASGDGLPDYVVLTLTNVNTNGWYPIRQQMRDAAGALIAGVFDRVMLSHQLKIDVAQADVGSIVTITPVYHRAL